MMKIADFSKFLITNDNIITTPKGFYASAVSAGIKKDKSLDLALLLSKKNVLLQQYLQKIK